MVNRICGSDSGWSRHFFKVLWKEHRQEKGQERERGQVKQRQRERKEERRSETVVWPLKQRLSSIIARSALTDTAKQGISGNGTGRYMATTSPQQAWFILLWEIFGNHNQINSKLKFLFRAIKFRLSSVSISITFSQGVRMEREIVHSSVTSQSDQLDNNDIAV